MSSFASTPGVRARMQAVRRKDTAPELALRRQCYRLGLRSRLDLRPDPDLNRRADLVFQGVRVAVFVDGCFWHGCPLHGRRDHRVNSEYWIAKINRNQERDQETTRLLEARGWAVVRVWEHEDPTEAAIRIRAVVAKRRQDQGDAS